MLVLGTQLIVPLSLFSRPGERDNNKQGGNEVTERFNFVSRSMKKNKTRWHGESWGQREVGWPDPPTEYKMATSWVKISSFKTLLYLG